MPRKFCRARLGWRLKGVWPGTTKKMTKKENQSIGTHVQELRSKLPKPNP
jgi:hypothetical protein